MTRPDREIWAGMLAYLQNQHPALCRHWFNDLDPVLMDAGTLFVRAQSEVHRDYLRRHALDAFNDAVRAESMQLLSIRFLGPGEEAPEPTAGVTTAQRVKARQAAQEQVRDEAKANADKTNTDASPTDGDLLHADLDAKAQNSPKNGPKAEQSIAGTSAGSSNTKRDESMIESKPVADRTAAQQQHTTNSQPNTQGNNQSQHQSQPDANPHRNGNAGNAPPPRTPARTPARRPAPIIGASEAALADHPDALNINPDHNFENFVVGRANRVAYAASQAVGDAPGDAYNPLFIHGGVGLGKTHLLQSICLRVLDHRPDAVIYYLSCEAFVTQFVDAIRAGQMTSFRHRYRDVDVLVIDDIHFLTGHDRTQEEFFHTFNSLYQARKQIVLSSDAPPEEIPDLEDRLVSRFKWGLVAEMLAPEFETRTAIVQTKAKLRGLIFPTDVASFIAERVDRNVRELEGAITTIQIRAQVEHRAIDLELVREVMGDAPVAALPAQPTLNQITDAVTRYFNIKVTDVQSRRRHKSVSLPRQVCMYLARKKTRYSLEEIGGFYGGRDHTTVMHAVKAITERSTSETDLVSAIESIEMSLKV